MIFVSCEGVDSKFAKSLIERLRAENLNVFHSPRNPLHGEDIRWDNWYEKGLGKELNQLEIFILIVKFGLGLSLTREDIVVF